MRFAPGRSGNPGGRSKVIAEVRDLARRYMPLAINTLADIAQNGRQESARVAAATALLDRGYGKPTQPISGDDEMRPAELPAAERQRLCGTLLIEPLAPHQLMLVSCEPKLRVSRPPARLLGAAIE